MWRQVLAKNCTAFGNRNHLYFTILSLQKFSPLRTSPITFYDRCWSQIYQTIYSWLCYVDKVQRQSNSIAYKLGIKKRWWEIFQYGIFKSILSKRRNSLEKRLISLVFISYGLLPKRIITVVQIHEIKNDWEIAFECHTINENQLKFEGDIWRLPRFSYFIWCDPSLEIWGKAKVFLLQKCI